MGRRINRSSPELLTYSEQEAVLRDLQGNEPIIRALETLTGTDFSSMTDQQKIAAWAAFNERGRALAPTVQSARVQRDLIQLADAANGNLDLADRLVRAEQREEGYREEVDALRAEVARLTGVQS